MVRLDAPAMIVPARTTTAPIGTSFLLAPSRARSSALRMYCSSTDDAISDPKAVTPRPLSIGNRGLGRFAESQLALRIPVDHDVVAFAELPFQNRHRQRILQQALDRALQWARAKRRIIAFGGQHFPRRGRELERELSFAEQGFEPLELEIDDVLDLLFAERAEDDDVVDTIEELGAEMLA